MPLRADFSGSPTSGPVPLTVRFTDESGSAPTSWEWDFGDAGTSSVQSPIHEYTSTGQYTVSLTVANAAGSDTETKTDYITVTPPPPVAQFSGYPTDGWVPLTVHFIDQSTNNPTSWEWNFGDTGTSSVQSPFHEYTSTGQFAVSLTATNAEGSDSETKTDYITVTSPPPVAQFSGSPTDGPAPLTVDFTDLSTNGPTSWEWDFGDGGTSALQNPSHDYTSTGTYTVALTAANAAGQYTKIKTDYITVTVAPPVADFIGDPTSGPAPLTVDFTDLSTNDPTSWEWDFGDGGSSTDRSPSHKYTSTGRYSVSLTAANAAGQDTESKTNYVIVGDAGVAAFSATPTEGIMGMSVTFTDESTGDIDSWEWNFGNGGTSGDQSPSHVYADPGIYDVTLTVTDAYGTDVETKIAYIWVGFLDCGPDNWAFENVLLCVDADIVQGYEGGYYEPTWPVNRGQMATYISRALAGGDSSVPDASPPATFDDVSDTNSAWAWKYVEYAVAQNVVSGYNPTTYAPEVEVDRGQMAVFIARATGWITLGDPMDTAPELFPDVPAGFWSGTAIQACVDSLVVQGYLDGNYHPDNVVTRDQMAVYVARAFGLLP